MRGKTDEGIKAEREKAIKEVESQLGEKVEVIDSFFEGAPHDAKPLWFLGKRLELLAQADIAYFCRGWQDYRGCRIENTCAKEYGIEHIVYFKEGIESKELESLREKYSIMVYKLNEKYMRETDENIKKIMLVRANAYRDIIIDIGEIL